MHPPQETEAPPIVGSLVGRHLIVRELAIGPIGPLYLARTQSIYEGCVTAIDTLARVIPLPADLPAEDVKVIADAIWSAVNVSHDLVLRVNDVIAKDRWVTLVHDFLGGGLLATLQSRAREGGFGFPCDIAARIVLDVLEGLEQSHAICEANRIVWRAGSTAMGSLYLCGDGRTRALDGQVVAATLRSAHMRFLCETAAGVAPEMLYGAFEPDERTDVFAVGAVLWELLTGRVILVDPAAPNTNALLSIPNSAQVPRGLVDTLHRALELDPNRRQSTLRELAVGIAVGVERVATYAQVIEFASAFMPFESVLQAEPAVPTLAFAEPAQSATVDPSRPAAAGGLEQMSVMGDDDLHIAVAVELDAAPVEPLAQLECVKTKPGASDRPVVIPLSSSGGRRAPAWARSQKALKVADKNVHTESLNLTGERRISRSTLILGCSTAVLAAILVLIQLQSRSTPNGAMVPPPTIHAEQPVTQLPQQPVLAQPEPAKGPSSHSQAPTVSGRNASIDAGVAVAAKAKGSRRPARSSAAAKAITSGDDGTSDGPKRQMGSKTYVPDDL